MPSRFDPFAKAVLRFEKWLDPAPHEHYAQRTPAQRTHGGWSHPPVGSASRIVTRMDRVPGDSHATLSVLARDRRKRSAALAQDHRPSRHWQDHARDVGRA